MDNEVLDLKKYIRVTDVLHRFSGMQYVKPNLLEEACQNGSKVHSYCENYADHEFFVPEPHLKGYLDSFVKWHDQYVDSIVYKERRLFSDKLGLTGKFDMIVKFKGDDRNVLIDLKTSSSFNKTYNLQLAAYRYLSEENKLCAIDRTLCVILDSEGNPPKVKETEYFKNLDLFLNALALHKYFK